MATAEAVAEPAATEAAAAADAAAAEKAAAEKAAAEKAAAEAAAAEVAVAVVMVTVVVVKAVVVTAVATEVGTTESKSESEARVFCSIESAPGSFVSAKRQDNHTELFFVCFVCFPPSLPFSPSLFSPSNFPSLE